MTNIIKLVVALVFLNAVAHAGMAAYKSYNFEDAVREALLFAPSAKDDDITDRIMGIADDNEVPLEAANIQISRTQNEVKVQLSYNEDISLVPGLFTKTWTFTPSASARILAGVSIPQKPRPRR